MKIWKKDNIKQIIILSFLWIGIILFLFFLLLNWQHQEYKKEFKEAEASILGEVIQRYPEAEQEIIQELQKEERDKNKTVIAKQLLEKYGIEEEQLGIHKLDKQLNTNLKMNLSILFIMGISFLILFLVFMIYKDRKIMQITKYLKRIQQKDYSLDIQDNTEGELSQLKNEIYKITVMLKEQAENLCKEKESLSNSISDISHQLKTPLTSISVMIDILQDGELPEEKRIEFISEISRQLNWINWLVVSLLKLSKLEAGMVIFKKEKILVSDLVNTTLKNLSILAELKNIEIKIEGKKEVTLEGDFNWLEEAILNIVKNCMEHSKENGVVKINFSENTLYTEIKIEDTGSGIAKEDLPYIFNRFYKGKNSSKESYGIGLALAYAIIKEQNGNISVKSEEGTGSEFSIKLYKGII